MKEVFKDIPGYEGLYQVSNLGRVKSLNPYGNKEKERILKPQKSKNGYLQLVLFKNKLKKMYYVHRLVATTFIENPENLPQVNHIDQNKLNNSVDNLEFCTCRYNKRYSKAKKVGCYKDGKLIKVYDAARDVDKDGFNHGNVCSVLKGRYKSSGGFQWKYID